MHSSACIWADTPPMSVLNPIWPSHCHDSQCAHCLQRALVCRLTIAGSLIGGIKETQEMLDFCGKNVSKTAPPVMSSRAFSCHAHQWALNAIEHHTRAPI